MKKLIVLVTMVVVFAMTGMTSMAATPRQYEEYELVKTGIEKDLDELQEDEDVTYISVEKKEFPREKVCIYNVKLTIADEGDFTVHYYLNGETEEVYAVMFDEDGEIVESEVETLSDAADWYRE